MLELGNIAEDATLDFVWSSNDASGASITRATDGTVAVYKGNSTTESTAGITDTEDFDTLTGAHHVRIDTSADAFYAVGNDYNVVLQGAVIDGQTVNAPIARFSIENRRDEAAIDRILLALPNAAADAAGGLPISDSGALDLDAEFAKLGTPTDFGSGTSTLAANLQDIADDGTATFDRTTDSLQAIRDRGDSAWTTGSGGSGATVDALVAAIRANVPAVVAAADGTEINVYTHRDWEIPITDRGDLTGYANIVFTVKSLATRADSQSDVQIDKSTGLLVLRGSSEVTAGDGAITIDDLTNGDLTITLKPAASDLLTAGPYKYDLYWIDGSGKEKTLSAGDLELHQSVGH